jgi:hypothetical protein
MSGTISNGEDIIDSRDVIARIEELQDIEERDEDEQEELDSLLALQLEAEGYCDWADGAGLIRDSYFKTYTQELAEDLGLLPRDARWPNTCIDWDQAARELRMDYTCVDFDGVDYWVR